MKKYLVLALAVVFVLGFAASSFAIHAEIPAETQAVVAGGGTQITIGGDLRFRGLYQRNTQDFDSNASQSGSGGDASKYDTRVRLSVDAKVTPNTEGFIQLEGGNDSGASQDINNWGTPAANGSFGATGSLPFANNKVSSMKILQAWILHQGTGLLGVPALVKVGHMPIQIGPNGLFYEHTKFGDDAILLGADPVKGMHLILGTVKMSEGSVGISDDINAYTFIGSYDFAKDTGVGLDVTYADGQNVLAGADLHLWNFGVNGKIRVVGLGIKGEFDVQDVKFEDVPSSAHVDDKYITTAAKLDFDYRIDPVTLMLTGAYGSGNNNKSALGSKSFVTSQSFIQHSTFIYEYLTANAAGNLNGGGLQNTWYVKLAAKADIMKNLDATLSLYYLQAMTKMSIGTGAYNTAGTSKNIGTEIDWIANYKIDKNLTYYVEGGYLFAGDFWKGANNTSNAALYRDRSPDDAWAIRHGIQLSF